MHPPKNGQITMNHLKIYPPSKHNFEKFSDVTTAVYDYIYGSKHTNQKRLIRLLSSTEMPTDFIESYEVYSFGDFNLMSIYPSMCAVLRIRWYREKEMWRWDKEGAENFTPNVILHALEISRAQFDQFFGLFANARISIFPDPFAQHNNIGNDGTDYKLTFGDDWLGVTYRWWHQTDGTWKQLSENVTNAKYLVDTWIDEHEKSQRIP
jgi:hypothetical protein